MRGPERGRMGSFPVGRRVIHNPHVSRVTRATHAYLYVLSYAAPPAAQLMESQSSTKFSVNNINESEGDRTTVYLRSGICSTPGCSLRVRPSMSLTTQHGRLQPTATPDRGASLPAPTFFLYLLRLSHSNSAQLRAGQPTYTNHHKSTYSQYR